MQERRPVPKRPSIKAVPKAQSQALRQGAFSPTGQSQGPRPFPTQVPRFSPSPKPMPTRAPPRPPPGPKPMPTRAPPRVALNNPARQQLPLRNPAQQQLPRTSSVQSTHQMTPSNPSKQQNYGASSKLPRVGGYMPQSSAANLRSLHTSNEWLGDNGRGWQNDSERYGHDMGDAEVWSDDPEELPGEVNGSEQEQWHAERWDEGGEWQESRQNGEWRGSHMATYGGEEPEEQDYELTTATDEYEGGDHQQGLHYGNGYGRDDSQYYYKGDESFDHAYERSGESQQGEGYGDDYARDDSQQGYGDEYEEGDSQKGMGFHADDADDVEARQASIRARFDALVEGLPSKPSKPSFGSSSRRHGEAFERKTGRQPARVVVSISPDRSKPSKPPTGFVSANANSGSSRDKGERSRNRGMRDPDAISGEKMEKEYGLGYELMKKMGYKEGSGLGKKGQGLSVPLMPKGNVTVLGKNDVKGRKKEKGVTHPGHWPGLKRDVVPGMPGSMPGVPGMMPGMIPGMMPGMMPGMTSGMPAMHPMAMMSMLGLLQQKQKKKKKKKKKSSSSSSSSNSSVENVATEQKRKRSAEDVDSAKVGKDGVRRVAVKAKPRKAEVIDLSDVEVPNDWDDAFARLQEDLLAADAIDGSMAVDKPTASDDHVVDTKGEAEEAPEQVQEEEAQVVDLSPLLEGTEGIQEETQEEEAPEQVQEEEAQVVDLSPVLEGTEGIQEEAQELAEEQEDLPVEAEEEDVQAVEEDPYGFAAAEDEDCQAIHVGGQKKAPIPIDLGEI